LVGNELSLFLCPVSVLLVCASFRLDFVFPAKLLIRSEGNYLENTYLLVVEKMVDWIRAYPSKCMTWEGDRS
jgi:hypothetical protein